MQQEGRMTAAAFQAPFAACGLAMTVCAGHVLASEIAAARVLGQVVNAVANGVPVALRLRDPGAGVEADERLSLICDRLGRALQRAGVRSSGLEVTIAGDEPGPLAAVRIRRKTLGAGTINFVLSDEGILAAPRPDNSHWRQLWRLRSGPVVVACDPVVTSRCPLLSPERATDVVPGLGLQAPEQSAWLVVTLDLAALPGSSFDDDIALQRLLCRYVDRAEALHDVTVWPTPVMQEDAWLNRRIAIRIDGIGKLAEKLGLDPCKHASKTRLDALLSRVRNLIANRSRQIAQSGETLPAIAAAKPCRHLRKSDARDAWELRWLRATKLSALRHRNLIVMSPWSVFPQYSADYRYSNLLPLLAHADACEFNRRVDVEHWSLEEFVDFHRRVWAVRRSAETALAVAEQP